jgi:predicted DNA-binding protein (MmcQ/YjbR family)
MELERSHWKNKRGKLGGGILVCEVRRAHLLRFKRGIWGRCFGVRTKYIQSRKMNLDTLRTFCLSLPGATEEVQWKTDLLFKVGGKIFAITGFGPKFGVMLKSDPETFADLVEREGIIKAPYLGHRHWISIISERAMSDAELKKTIRNSYDLVRAKLTRKVQDKLSE